MGVLLVVISAPSGAGKTSVINKILENALLDYHYSVSATTRPPRKGEANGVHYNFLSEENIITRVTGKDKYK